MFNLHIVRDCVYLTLYMFTPPTLEFGRGGMFYWKTFLSKNWSECNVLIVRGFLTGLGTPGAHFLWIYSNGMFPPCDTGVSALHYKCLMGQSFLDACGSFQVVTSLSGIWMLASLGPQSLRHQLPCTKEHYRVHSGSLHASVHFQELKKTVRWGGGDLDCL